MDNEGYKEVKFWEYCGKCVHKDVKESDLPCDECLTYGINLYSHKPVNWRPAKGFEGWVAPEPTGDGDANAGA